MAKLKALMIGTVIGLCMGLWGGVNIGKGQPLYANPFLATPVSTQLSNAGKAAIRQSGEALEKAGEAIKDSTNGESER